MNRKPLKYLCGASALLILDAGVLAVLARWIAGHGLLTRFLALPLAFVYLHASLVIAIISILTFRKVRQKVLDTSMQRLEPELFRAFSEFAYEGGDGSGIQKAYRQHPRAVEHLLINFMPSVTGSALDTFGQLTVKLGLLAKWQNLAKSPNFAKRKEATISLSNLPLTLSRDALGALLDDAEEEIGILAARALVRTGDPALIERIFLTIVDHTLLVRACVTEDLRKYAAILSQSAVPKALYAADQERIGIVLAILGAWQRSLYLDNWETIYREANFGNRIAMLNLLPYIVTAEQPSDVVLDALNDPEERVRIAASDLIGRWQLNTALPALSAILRGDKTDVAKAAAKALTALGDAGTDVLQNTIVDVGGESGRIALEALESLATQR